ncbi:MAG: hypothetical protein V4582_00750 [Pseudomonadota bacterium]
MTFAATALMFTSAPQAQAATVKTLSLQPANVTLAAGASSTLSGSYANIATRNLAWRVLEGSAGGTLKAGTPSNGIQLCTYRAPANAGTYHVRYYDKSQPLVSAQATITVTAATPVVVSVSPASATIQSGATMRFVATVTGTSKQGVTWTTSNGSIGADGSYTAPATAGTASVRATSVQDPSKSASASVTIAAPVPVPVPVPGDGRTFTETFPWHGNHASTINKTNSSGSVDHVGSTVWWNEDAWDIVGDSGYLATAYDDFGGTIGKQTGFHVDVHKALSADPTNSEEDNTVLKIGGDGSPGEAAMRMDEQGILGARLRNPMMVSASAPGVVEFYAPRFVTTGHWWEVAITPAESVVGGGNTSVPEQVGRRPFEDSLNVVVIGQNDVPCDVGWRVRFDVSRSIGGVETLLEEEHPSFDDYTATDPLEKEVLYHWRIEYRPSGVDLYADFAKNGQLLLQRHVDIAIPWSLVHVHLLGVAYQADHHPQGACFQGKVRELNWRNVSVAPVKYARTTVAPRNGVTLNLQRQDGWMGYDLRDIQRFGAPVDGAPQANLAAYSLYGAMAFGSVDMSWFGAPAALTRKELNVDIDSADAAAALAQLVYDIKGRGWAQLTVNGTVVGAMPSMGAMRYYAQQAPNDNGFDVLDEYAHRAMRIPPGLLRAGANTIRLDLNGEVILDRLHLEFSHAQ